MTKMFITALLLGATAVSLAAQTPHDAIIARANAGLAAIQKGTFQLDYRFKFLMENDTLHRTNTVYFFKDQPAAAQLARFVTTDSAGVSAAFDGTTLFRFLHSQKTIQTMQAISEASIYNDLDKMDILEKISYFHLRTNKSLIHLRPDNLPLFEQVNDAPQPFLRLSRLDSFPNPLKSTPFDPDSIRQKMELHIDLAGSHLSRVQNWVWMLDETQYTSVDIGPVTQLPASARFEDYFQLDAWLAKGYSLQDVEALEQQEAEAPKEAEKPLAAADFALQDLQGNTHRLSEQKGYVLLDFWYRSCYPCLKAMPVIENIHQKYKDRGLVVWGVNATDLDAEKLRAFLEKRLVTYPSLMDTDKAVTQNLQVKGFPRLFIVEAPSGKIVFDHEGYSEGLEEALEKFLGEHLGK